MEYLYGAGLVTVVVGAGTLIWWLAKHWSKSEDRANAKDGERDTLKEERDELAHRITLYQDELAAAHEALRLATAERDQYHRTLDDLEDRYANLVASVAISDPGAISDAIRDQLRRIEALRDRGALAAAAREGDGAGPGPVHGPASGGTP